jgi:hypothetical protein
MFADADHLVPPAKRAPAGPAARLRDALVSLAGGHSEVLRHHEKPWASITFEGARHTLELRFVGPEAVAAGETLVAELPEHEFAVPGHIVADATVTAVDHVLAPEPMMTVTCELLLLKDV